MEGFERREFNYSRGVRRVVKYPLAAFPYHNQAFTIPIYLGIEAVLVPQIMSSP